MSYLDAYLQPCPGYGWQGGPSFNTQIVQMANGRERRNANWATAHHMFDAPFNNISKEAYRLIKQMHLVCRGRLNCFKFRDELDYQAVGQQFGLGDGVETVFQLSTLSAIDGVTYVRDTYVVSPDLTPTILVNGSPAAHTIDADRGLVTFSAPPGVAAVLTGTWNFDLWVRFDQDSLPFSIDNVNAVNGSVSLLEQPPPPL
jgi:uncharacterized protein (TIGR02217 family)